VFEQIFDKSLIELIFIQLRKQDEAKQKKKENSITQIKFATFPLENSNSENSRYEDFGDSKRRKRFFTSFILEIKSNFILFFFGKNCEIKK
jgi:hypothetical protein